MSKGSPRGVKDAPISSGSLGALPVPSGDVAGPLAVSQVPGTVPGCGSCRAGRGEGAQSSDCPQGTLGERHSPIPAIRGTSRCSCLGEQPLFQLCFHLISLRNRIIPGVNNLARAGTAGSMAVFNTCASSAAARQQLREQRLGFSLLPPFLFLFFPPKIHIFVLGAMPKFLEIKVKAVSRDDGDNKREERVRKGRKS